MLWLILGFSWLASVILILSLLGVVRERENESAISNSLQSCWPSSFRITDGTLAGMPGVDPSRRVA